MADLRASVKGWIGAMRAATSPATRIVVVVPFGGTFSGALLARGGCPPPAVPCDSSATLTSTLGRMVIATSGVPYSLGVLISTHTSAMAGTVTPGAAAGHNSTRDAIRGGFVDYQLSYKRSADNESRDPQAYMVDLYPNAPQGINGQGASVNSCFGVRIRAYVAKCPLPAALPIPSHRLLFRGFGAQWDSVSDVSCCRQLHAVTVCKASSRNTTRAKAKLPPTGAGQLTRIASTCGHYGTAGPPHRRRSCPPREHGRPRPRGPGRSPPTTDKLRRCGMHLPPCHAQRRRARECIGRGSLLSLLASPLPLRPMQRLRGRVHTAWPQWLCKRPVCACVCAGARACVCVCVCVCVRPNEGGESLGEGEREKTTNAKAAGLVPVQGWP